MHARSIRFTLVSAAVAAAAAVALWAGDAEATRPMRQRSLQGCVAGEFIIGDAESAGAVWEIAEFELPASLDVDWSKLDGQTVRMDYVTGDAGTRSGVRRVTRLTGPPQAIGPCPPAARARLGTVLYEQAEERSRDIDPFKDLSQPLSPREQAAGNYSVDLINRAVAADTGSCLFAVSRAFILEHARRFDEARAQLEKTRSMSCDPLVERVTRAYRPMSRLPVTPASDEEVQAWEKAR